MATQHVDNDLRNESTGELIKHLTEDIRTLVGKEVELAKAELTVKGKKAGKGAGLLGGGATMGLLALGTFTATLIGLLDQAMDFWVAALIVTVVYGAIAAVLALQGKNKVQEAGPPVPEEAADSVKEDMKWLKNQR